jgi:hypothetical protein
MKTKKQTIAARQWDIDGFPNYFFNSKKQLFRVSNTGSIRENKMIMIGYTKGYVLKSKFYSLTKLDTLLLPHAN